MVNCTLPKKLEEWSDESFITLKVPLQQCLRLIRYFLISNSNSRKQRFHPRTTSYSLTNYYHKFQLILRGSKDGFTTRTFWDICDGRAYTIVFIEVKGKDKFLADDNFQNLILSRVQNQNYPWYLFDIDKFEFAEFMSRKYFSSFLKIELSEKSEKLSCYLVESEAFWLRTHFSFNFIIEFMIDNNKYDYLELIGMHSKI
ncbi:hypothetical protein Glove_217g63 [Diversispora epigaea]|uniref:Uncharacterized protein n=1 Tax=Diversispora epigaea TaxID=1348612 RepID=A0A397IR19_9GLOM|nr:hypothetical protein Glove_217g63 [Diversispora epigaea]